MRQAAIIDEGRRQPVQSSELRALASAALAAADELDGLSRTD
ncbi:hypothetical protein [Mycolicibacterium tusciae]|nr:hypothetical protein [Mycolicibacterium tusciae]